MSLVAFDSGSVPASFIWMLSSGARTKGDLVWVSAGSSGPVDVAVSSSATVRVAAVACHDIASGAKGLYQLSGSCFVTVPSASYTDARGLETDAGVIEDSGAAFGNTAAIGAQTNTDFAVVMGTQATVTSCLCCLHGQPYASTT